MWLFVCFDLPAVAKQEQRKAYRFRRTLLKQGYSMLQRSMYARPCYTVDRTEQFIKDLKNIAPDTGSVQIFSLTDQQWSKTIHIEGTNYQKSKYQQELGQEAPQQAAFW